MRIEIFPHQSINETLSKMNEHDELVLNDGTYFEKVIINIPNIRLFAKNPHKAIIQNKDYYHKIMNDNNECNTFNTFTVYVGSDNVILEGIIIENLSTPSSVYGQAVALHVDGTKFLCKNCLIKSAQDTLFTGPMPENLLIRYKGFYSNERLLGKPSKQIYDECTIIGDVDFIFGGATALFNKCEIISQLDNNKSGYICAPSHSFETPFGYLFYECNITSTSLTYLARPWRDYGTAAFIKCSMENINPLGYNKWNETNRDKTARFFEYTEGISLKERVSWSNQLTDFEAKKYYIDFLNYLNEK